MTTNTEDMMIDLLGEELSPGNVWDYLTYVCTQLGAKHNIDDPKKYVPLAGQILAESLIDEQRKVAAKELNSAIALVNKAACRLFIDLDE